MSREIMNESRKEILSEASRESETRVLVSEIAKLYGLTNQTIHYYEGKKIIKPERDILNNYRYFNESDIKRLGAIKKYRNAEFTLEEAQQMCEVDDFDEIIAKMSKRKDAVLDHIKHQQMIADRLEEQVGLSLRYKTSGSKPMLELLSAHYILAAYDNEVIYQEAAFKTEAASWFQNNFFTHACSLYQLELGDENHKSSSNADTRDDMTSRVIFRKVAFGMVASETIKDFLSLEVTDNVIVIAGGKFVTATAIVGSDAEIQYELQSILAFLKQMGYALRAQPFIKTIFASKDKNNQYLLFVQIHLPIF